jgi:phosphatidylglycerophosphatase A
VALAALVAVVGALAAGKAARALGEKDPGCIVIDEVAGYLVATAFVPHSLGYLLGAFVLFRFFDIAKPGPIGRLQDIPGGWGIMADDLAAGLAANAVLQLWRIQPWM